MALTEIIEDMQAPENQVGKWPPHQLLGLKYLLKILKLAKKSPKAAEKLIDLWSGTGTRTGFNKEKAFKETA